MCVCVCCYERVLNSIMSRECNENVVFLLHSFNDVLEYIDVDCRLISRVEEAKIFDLNDFRFVFNLIMLRSGVVSFQRCRMDIGAI